MKDKWSCFVRNNAIYFVMFLAIFLVHMNIEPLADDIWFGEILDTYSVWGFVKERYFTWASRSIIETILIVLTHCPLMIWRVMDSFVYVGIAWALARLISENNRYIKLASCTWWMTYPFIHMNSAGYIATTLNYIWPLFCVLVALIFLKKQINGKKMSVWEHILNIICILYGANTEQGTAVLFGAYVVVIGYFRIRKKKLPRMVYVQLMFVVAEMIYILTCPGNTARILYETEHLFPEYAALGFVRKLEMGITSAMYHFLFIENVVFALFALVLWLVSGQYAKNTVEKCICVTPFALSMCFSMFSGVFYSWFPRLEYFRYSLTEFGTLFSGKPETILPCLIYMTAGLSVLYSVYLFSREKWIHALLLFVFIAFGFGSRVMMGFSASIWASMDRTFLFMYMGFILASLYMLTLAKNEKVKTGVFYATVITGISSYLTVLVSVL